MGENSINEEIRSSSQILILITLSVFSAVLVFINVVLKWDRWIIPVIIVGALVCINLQLFQRLDIRSRNYVFGSFLIFEVFYYTVNARSLTDGTALFTVLIFLLTLTGEKLLYRMGLVSGVVALLLNVIRDYSQHDYDSDVIFFLHCLWQLALVLLVYYVASHAASSWDETEKHYIRRISEIEAENVKANDFLANVSHEIRTPVNAVIGLSSVLLREGLPEKAEENVRNIFDSGQEISGKIGDILDFTEVDMHKLSVNNENYVMNSIVVDILSRIRFAGGDNIDVIVDMEPSLPRELKGDAEKIKKILWHLLRNACKFTREGGVYIHIYSIRRDYGINLIMEVTDTGIGMSDTEIDRIYEKFYQTDSGRSRMIGGLGLGIPIVNSFTRKMGGFLTIKSSPGNGTSVLVSIPQVVTDDSPCLSLDDGENYLIVGLLSFSNIEVPRVREFYMNMISHLVEGFSVPFRRVQTKEELKNLIDNYRITHLFVGSTDYTENKEYIDSLSDRTMVALFEDPEVSVRVGERITVIGKPFPNSSIASFLNQSPDEVGSRRNEKLICPGVKALVVDDEPMNLTVARGIFEEYEMEVKTALSGAQAIEICEKEDFDIIFMDHMMPEMDGVEAMKRLRDNADKKDKSICVVALTANNMSSAKEMFLSEGFDGFISKPVELSDLERVLRRLLPSSAFSYKRILSDEEKTASITGRNWSLEPLERRGLNTESGIAHCLDDPEFYKEYLVAFSAFSSQGLRALKAAFDDQDPAEYRIRAHLLKLVAKMVGADEILRDATVLEDSVKTFDREKMLPYHSALMRNCESLATDIAKSAGGILD